jgi:hypothetical protein
MRLNHNPKGSESRCNCPVKLPLGLVQQCVNFIAGTVVCGVQILALISVLPDWKSLRESATKTYTNRYGSANYSCPQN